MRLTHTAERKAITMARKPISSDVFEFRIMRDKMEPTNPPRPSAERSVLPIRKMKVSPSDMTRGIATWFSRLRRFVREKNPCAIMEKTTIRRSRIPKGAREMNRSRWLCFFISSANSKPMRETFACFSMPISFISDQVRVEKRVGRRRGTSSAPHPFKNVSYRVRICANQNMGPAMT